MRSQHKFVITAGLLCHLFVTAPLVTSQAPAEQVVQNPGVPVEQATPTPSPTPTPSGPDKTVSSGDPPGNCHSVTPAPRGGRKVSPRAPAKPNENPAAP